MLDTNLFNANNINRHKPHGLSVRARRTSEQKYRYNTPSKDALDRTLRCLEVGELSINQLTLNTGYCSTFIFKILKALEGEGKIIRRKDVGESGRPESFITLV